MDIPGHGRELEKSTGEVTRHVPRVVIYGQVPYRWDAATDTSTGGHYEGAKQISVALSTYLKEHGVADDGVVISRQVDNIDNVFYRGNRADVPEPDIVSDTAPDIVFVLPQMRGYDLGGYSLPTPTDYIEALCQEHGVPIVIVSENITSGEISEALGQLLALNPGPAQA